MKKKQSDQLGYYSSQTILRRIRRCSIFYEWINTYTWSEDSFTILKFPAIYFSAQRKQAPATLPRIDEKGVEASGQYIDLQDTNTYESMEGMTSKTFPRYAPKRNPKNVMEETFDGSRMPKTIAPKPPNMLSKLRASKKFATERKVETGDHLYEDYESDQNKSDNNSRSVEVTYETPDVPSLSNKRKTVI
ncbi:hypothetical protein ACF0H5_016263 [Mactra antiquata]